MNRINPSNLVINQGSVQELIELLPEGVNGILCNILAEVIIEIIPELTTLAKPSSWGILSGILVDQAKPIADTLEQHGWTVAALWKRENWCCLNIRR